MYIATTLKKLYREDFRYILNPHIATDLIKKHPDHSANFVLHLNQYCSPYLNRRNEQCRLADKIYRGDIIITQHSCILPYNSIISPGGIHPDLPYTFRYKLEDWLRTAPSRNKPGETLTFNGKYLIWLGQQNDKKYEWRAISGKSGYQSGKHQKLADKGPIPEGTWLVKQNQSQAIGDRAWYEVIAAELGRTAWPGGESAWGKHRIWLEPADDTNTHSRTGFSIHGGDDPGSAGCIDLTKNMQDFISKFIRYGHDMILKVKYE